MQVENSTTSLSTREWSEVVVPVPYLESFSSSWFYTFSFLHTSTVYDVIGLGKIKMIYYNTGNNSKIFLVQSNANHIQKWINKGMPK